MGENGQEETVPMSENSRLDLAGMWERIKIAFKTKNGAEIARKLNLGGTSVYKWRDGKNPPSHETLIKISEVTGCSLDWLMTGQGGQFKALEAVGTNEPTAKAEDDEEFGVLFHKYKNLTEDDKQEIRILLKSVRHLVEEKLQKKNARSQNPKKTGME